MTEKASVIILAGGRSSRMREDKALLEVPGTGMRLIEKISRELGRHFKEIIISLSAAGESENNKFYDSLPYRVVRDSEGGQGPLMGILSGLRVSGTPVNFVTACDIPEIKMDFVREMMAFTGEYDIVVPVTGEGKYEPIFSFYHRRLIPSIEDLLKRGIRKIIELYPLCRVKTVPLRHDGWYRNLNTYRDYLDYLESLK